MSKRNRALKAHHEAAHAVIARYLNVGCVGIFMFPAEPGAAASAMTQSAAYHAGDTIEQKLAGIRHDALISFAGPIANVLFTGKPSAISIGVEDDLTNIRSHAARIVLMKSGRPAPTATTTIGVDAEMVDAINETVETLKNEAHALVKERWPAIEAVAAALMETDLMDEATLDRIIARAVPA
jgi:ATP-dependent Zn protease